VRKSKSESRSGMERDRKSKRARARARARAGTGARAGAGAGAGASGKVESAVAAMACTERLLDIISTRDLLPPSHTTQCVTLVHPHI